MPTTFHATDLRTGVADPAVAEATRGDSRRVVAAARAALSDLPFADLARRAEAKRAAAARWRRSGDEIVVTAASEIGLPECSRLRGKMERTCVQLELLADACTEGAFR